MASSSRQTTLNFGQNRNPGGGQNHAARRAANAATAAETRTILPDILKALPNLQASKSEALYLDTLPALKSTDCPHVTPDGKVAVKIVNEDTFNAAISLAALEGSDHGRVAVLNMASHSHPGGGWLKGASAQEEALCYRSSLSLSLHKRYYPFQQRMGIYTPDVLIIRSDMSSGHRLLLPDAKHVDLPVASVLSIAGLRHPETSKQQVATPTGPQERVIFAKATDRILTKDKMRLCLRMAASRGHRLLVLGALGCGAFKNPPKEVANCWLEVLQEPEFQGGWWKAIWFAVFDRRNEGNFEIFRDVLDNVEV
jgi:hypothetical protein